MTLKKRIDELERKAGSKEPYWIIVQYEGAETSEAQKKAAIADYKANNPDWADKDILVIYVPNEETKDLLSGIEERTRKLLLGPRTE